MEAGPQKARRRARSDAARNRERLLVAARDVFAEGGSGASLEAVARRAAVGIGTLYRHFPTRDDLFQAVYRREVDELVELASQLMSEADAAAALRLWLQANLGFVATKRGMIAALAPAPEGPKALHAESRERMLAAIDALMRRAQSEGSVRRDIGADDMLQALYGIFSGHESPDWQDRAARLLDVFVDGLRT